MDSRPAVHLCRDADSSARLKARCGAAPIIHKSAAVSEVVVQLAIEADEDPELPRPAAGRKKRGISK